MYCGRSCRQTSIYVIGEAEAAPTVKVGYAGRPVKRLAQLRKKTGRDLAILGRIEAACEFKAMDIEEAAHLALKEHWSGRGEWFACSAEDALAAVKRAAKRLGLKGERG